MPAPTIWLTTLGCAKNQVDSDKLSALMSAGGYLDAGSPEEADVVIINTCAFVEEARRESIATILELQGIASGKTVVIGCMAQRFGVEVQEALPEVDAVLGLDRYGDLLATLDRLTGWRPVELRLRPVMDILNAPPRRRASLPYAYVKVAEGCDKPCTFCAIPLIRGRQRSRSPISIRSEMESLVAGGASEIVLVAQDLASYGRDLGAGGGLVGLLEFVSDVPGLRRLRLLYLYPREIRPALIEAIAMNPVIASYFDLSLQHASGDLLRLMKRPGDGERHLDLIESIRAADPEAALRSSFIVGFPGETDAQVEHLADFLGDARLDWAGFFAYSPEEGTAAAALPGLLPPDLIEERLRYLHDLQEEISNELAAAQLGRRLEVLIDQIEEGRPVARSHREAPEIDGVISLDRGSAGDWVLAEITDVYGTDLEGRVL